MVFAATHSKNGAAAHLVRFEAKMAKMSMYKSFRKKWTILVMVGIKVFI